jgi:hypothetical protein
MNLASAETEIRHFHFCCGLGAAAKGFNQGRAEAHGLRGRFRCIGGIDSSPAAIRDFSRSDSREVFDLWSILAPAYEFAVQNSASGLIAEERRRQIEAEGWSAEHDDAHAPGILLAAARAYAQHAQKQLWNQCGPNTGPPAMWPFAEGWWKPSDDPMRNMQKSAALIAAEMDARMRTSNRVKD